MATKKQESNGITLATIGFISQNPIQWVKLEQVAINNNIANYPQCIEEWINNRDILKNIYMQEYLWGNTAMPKEFVQVIHCKQYLPNPLSIDDLCKKYKVRRIKLIDDEIYVAQELAELLDNYIKDANLKDVLYAQISKYKQGFDAYMNSVSDGSMQHNLLLYAEHQRLQGIKMSYSFL